MAEAVIYRKVSQFLSAGELIARWAELGWAIPCDERILTAVEGSPLATPTEVAGRRVGNRWCIQPMEGWDGTAEGAPTEWTRRRWEHFGLSGAKLIWGCEAVAVRHDGRANPNQLTITERTQPDIARLLEVLRATHRRACGTTDDLLVGLQLTHSGRFCRPNRHDQPEPRVAYRHPILDARLGITDDSVVLSDEDLRRLIDDYVLAARRAAACGFDFVDLKCCHGYLGHELLSAHTRTGPFGGAFENRTRFLRELIGRVRDAVPKLGIGVRVSAFDFVPFQDDPGTRSARRKGVGVPVRFAHVLPYRYGFGVNAENPLEYDLEEPVRLLDMLSGLGVPLVNITGGSPYYNPHIQRPAYYPPSDGYQPPEDPLAGVARQIDVVRQLKARFPGLTIVGSAYTYLQDWLPQVAQAVVRAGWVDLVGIGRMVLSYPEMPMDSLRRGALDSKRICRTFSDCTTGPRKGLISGCYPLDEKYKASDAGRRLRGLKRD